MRSVDIAHIDVFGGAEWNGHGDAPVVLHAQTKSEAEEIFLRGMLDIPSQHGRRNPLELVVSVAVHVIVIGAILIAPLLFTEALDLHAFQTVFLVAPPPPPAPPPPAAAQALKTAKPVVPPINLAKLTAPAVIPPKVRIVVDNAPPEPGAGVEGGVPGGIAGGVVGGILGGAIQNTSAILPPPPPTRRIVRVGGNVRPPVALSTPEPRYPAIAMAAHIEGIVVIDAIIDEQGNVVQAKVIQGPPLLIAAALEAVTQWKYEPTYLNGQPVAVNTHVQVKFRLQ